MIPQRQDLSGVGMYECESSSEIKKALQWCENNRGSFGVVIDTGDFYKLCDNIASKPELSDSVAELKKDHVLWKHYLRRCVLDYLALLPELDELIYKEIFEYSPTQETD